MATTRTEHPHVVRGPAIAHGEPIIAGTRIRVALIARLLRAGDEPSDIIAAYPDLSAAAVYDAISYYLDHRDEIDALIDAATPDASALEHGFTVAADGRVAYRPR